MQKSKCRSQKLYIKKINQTNTCNIKKTSFLSFRSCHIAGREEKGAVRFDSIRISSLVYLALVHVLVLSAAVLGGVSYRIVSYVSYLVRLSAGLVCLSRSSSRLRYPQPPGACVLFPISSSHPLTSSHLSLKIFLSQDAAATTTVGGAGPKISWAESLTMPPVTGRPVDFSR